MKALVLESYNHFAYTDVPEPQLEEDTVLIRVAACGICGSDIHGMDGSSGRRQPPIVMGHEAAGVVERVGGAVRTVSPGMRVTFDSTVYCGSCRFCADGKINLCDNRRVLGVSCDEYRMDGAFAEFVAVPERIIYQLPESLSFESAAFVEPLSIAVHAEKRRQQCGGTAVVVGTGMIGLLVVQVLSAYGYDKIIAVDLDDHRLSLAGKFGAHETFNVGSTDVAREIVDATEGYGADVAFEAVGGTSPLKTALEGVRKGGEVVLIGNISPQVTLGLQSTVTREISIFGSCGSNGEYPECLEMLDTGKVDVEPLITAAAPLDSGPEWFARLYEGEAGALKVLLQPG